MAILSKEERKEMLRLSRSKIIKKDFQQIRENRTALSSKKRRDILNKYIEFLNISNRFINHKRKRLNRVGGNNFIL